jgi:expansin (peptidoglycan-binding protein)
MMTEKIHILYETYDARDVKPNVLRVFTDEQSARSWAALLNAAASDHTFPLTYAELKQEFDWVPEHHKDDYFVESYPVHESGWDGEL